MTKIAAAFLLRQERCSITEIAQAMGWSIYRARYLLSRGRASRWPWK